MNKAAWFLAWMRRLPQLAFWPFNRRQERYRIRLRKTRDELRRDRVAEEVSVASHLSVGERRALYCPPIPPPGPKEGYQGHGQRGGFGPREPSPPSSAATTPPADP